MCKCVSVDGRQVKTPLLLGGERREWAGLQDRGGQGGRVKQQGVGVGWGGWMGAKEEQLMNNRHL